MKLPLKFVLLCGITILSSVNLEAGLIKYDQVEDLSYQIDENSVYWAKDDSFKLNVAVATEDPEVGGWIAANTFSAGEHGGTHLDAPYHFNRYGLKVGEIPLQNFIKPGVLIDVRNKVKDDKYRLSVNDIKEWEAVHGPIPKGNVVLINFGWGARFYPNRQAFLGSVDPPYNFPSIGKEAATYLAGTGATGVGLDVASVDPGDSAETHKIFAAAGMYNLENVDLSKNRLPAKGFTLIVLPMKIAKGTGGPVRIIGLY